MNKVYCRKLEGNLREKKTHLKIVHYATSRDYRLSCCYFQDFRWTDFHPLHGKFASMPQIGTVLLYKINIC